MRGKIIEIEESAFGGEILIIKEEKVGGIFESRGFLNGLRGNPLVWEGDLVEFDVDFNFMANQWFAKNINLVEASNG